MVSQLLTGKVCPNLVDCARKTTGSYGLLIWCEQGDTQADKDHTHYSVTTCFANDAAKQKLRHEISKCECP